MSILHSTSGDRSSWWARAGAIGFVAVAAFGAVDRLAAPADAQLEPRAEPVSLTAAAEPLGADPANTAPAISDDASVVAFATVVDAVPRVAVRDRTAGTTLLVAEPQSSHPAVSGDGCIVAYIVESPVDPDDLPPDLDEAVALPNVELRVLDRCRVPAGEQPASLLVHTIDQAPAVAAPALSRDGTVVVWSTGLAVARFERFANAAGAVVYLEAAGFDPVGLVPGEGAVTGPDVDVSADGSVVAFVAGPGAERYGPRPPDVYVWSDVPADGAGPAVELASMPASPDPAAAVSPPEAGSTGPVLSDDGSIVLFESSDLDLAVVAADPGVVAPYVAMYERGAGARILAGDARRPAISGDGHHAVYEHGGVIWSMRWSDGPPFESVWSGPAVDAPAGAQPTTSARAVVSVHGGSIAFDSPDGVALTDDVRFHPGTHVWLWRQPANLIGAQVNLGAIDAPGARSGRATIANFGPAGFPIVAVATDDPFSVFATDCDGVLHPGAACTVDVVADISAPGAFEALIRLTGGVPITEFTVTISALGTDSTTTTSTTTSATSATTATSSVPPQTVPPRTVPPRTVPPRTIPPRTVPPRTTTVTTRAPQTVTTTTAPLPAVFNPASFEFAPTIVDAGRRSATVDLFNPSQRAVTVLSIGVDQAPGSGFQADATACQAQPIPPGGLCTVGLEFAPTVQGPLAATITADFTDGTRAVLVVNGIGAPPPTLTVTPEVAWIGQVVVVEGAGFPAGGTVVLTWDDGRLVRTASVDAVGGFLETIVVFPNTPSGPTEFVVAGQVDVFADVSADLLVSERRGLGVSVLGGLGPSVAR